MDHKEHHRLKHEKEREHEKKEHQKYEAEVEKTRLSVHPACSSPVLRCICQTNRCGQHLFRLSQPLPDQSLYKANTNEIRLTIAATIKIV